MKIIINKILFYSSFTLPLVRYMLSCFVAEMEMADYPFRYESFPFVPPERASGMLNRMPGGRFRRSRGIHEECCVNACTISELSSYCGP